MLTNGREVDHLIICFAQTSQYIVSSNGYIYISTNVIVLGFIYLFQARIKFLSFVAGQLFIQENMWRLAHEEEDWMLVGFEIALPSLLDMAKDLDLDIPYNEPALKEIYAERERKLAKYICLNLFLLFWKL
jgi:hypothetical protein